MKTKIKHLTRMNVEALNHRLGEHVYDSGATYVLLEGDVTENYYRVRRAIEQTRDRSLHAVLRKLVGYAEGETEHVESIER